MELVSQVSDVAHGPFWGFLTDIDMWLLKCHVSSEGMVAYFCNHLSDNCVDLSDLMSTCQVFLLTCQIFMLTCHFKKINLKTWSCSVTAIQIKEQLSEKSTYYLTSQHKDRK